MLLRAFIVTLHRMLETMENWVCFIQSNEAGFLRRSLLLNPVNGMLRWALAAGNGLMDLLLPVLFKHQTQLFTIYFALMPFLYIHLTSGGGLFGRRWMAQLVVDSVAVWPSSTGPNLYSEGNPRWLVHWFSCFKIGVSDGRCSICPSQVETVNHLFFDCLHAVGCWQLLLLGAINIVPDFSSGLILMLDNSSEKMARAGLRLFFIFQMCWSLWIARNKHTLDGAVSRDFNSHFMFSEISDSFTTAFLAVRPGRKQIRLRQNFYLRHRT